ncbi:MAG: PDZ domain-containing protein [Phycisphaerales bacterium]
MAISAIMLAAGAMSASADVQPAATMLRYPDISATHLSFVYANDIWIAPRMGGLATRLASPPGAESFPRFSPDGKTIAFVGNYEGNRDLYTLPLTGGVPQRVTHHPSGETLSDWTPDGSRLLFLSNGWAGLPRQTQLFSVPAGGGMPEKMPMPYSGFAALSADGEWVAFTPHSTDTRTWKRYRGGMATDVWLLNVKTGQSRQITDWEGTDSLPMWGHGPAASTVFYVSDAGPEHRLNIWSFDTRSGARAQVTTFADDDVKWPSMGPGPGAPAGPGQDAVARSGEIVFQLGATLRVLDVQSRAVREVQVTIPGDRPRIMPTDEDASDTMQGAGISPTGKRVLAVGRGDLWSLPVKEGVVRNLTRSDNVFEREAAWSPDGRWIAYFSDESGEYELWLRAADAREPSQDKDESTSDTGDQKGDDAGAQAGGAGGEKAGDEAKAPRPLEPTRLTDLGPGFRYTPVWSPDSTHLAFTDKAGKVFVAKISVDAGVAKAEVKEIDDDPGRDRLPLSWSSDSGWLAYTRADDSNMNPGVMLYEVSTGTGTRVTSAMTGVGSVCFDRAGDFLYMSSNRHWSPMYSDVDTTFIYAGSEVLLMVPLRADQKNPFAPKNDEEEIRASAESKPAEKKKDDAGRKPDAAAPDDGISGTWEGRATGGQLPPEGLPFTLRLKLTDGKLTGSATSAMGSGAASGTYNAAEKSFEVTFTVNNALVSFAGTITGDEASGTWSVGEDAGAWTGKRTGKQAPADEGPGGGGGGEGADKKSEKDKKKKVKIDLEGLEARAVPLPVAPGSFGDLAVSHDHKLVYVRGTSRGQGGEGGIKIFDPKEDSPEEKSVTSGRGFDMSADGKKLLVGRGGSLVVVEAAAGGGKAQTVSTGGGVMRVRVRPREEWKQIFHDAWRLQRDFFYEPTLHGVDWPKMRAHYGAMIDDCASREDVTYVIAELISELNIGHAYVTNPGDIEPGPGGVSVGLLGCDFALENGAYRITRIYEGAPWDSDARGPLSRPGLAKDRVHAGDYLLAVNGVPVDVTRDPWAALVGLANRPTMLTVSSAPALDGAARQVLVTPAGSEITLRYRAWIEAKRASVHEKTGGKVGYIYVPNTGVDGQNDLFRQFFGQTGTAALIIDERWNGGGQIPTRFIELLNRPVTNYWARRDAADWRWPPDGHPGPKCMLINGLAGSGGDMFPWLFRHNKLGTLIGTRTWGGLVGISGNPGLIDGGAISVPTFGFYKTDGTWGVEGHGVDPDMLVIDDPAKMLAPEPVPGPDGKGGWLGGGDPQLDAAIAHLLAEIEKNGYQPPPRPASPDRSGMGIPERDR